MQIDEDDSEGPAMSTSTPGDSNPAVNPAGDGVDISGAQVAQGGTGTRTFTILIISTVLVVIVLFAAFGIAALTKGATGPNGGGQEGVGKATGQAATVHAPEPSPRQNPPANSTGN